MEDHKGLSNGKVARVISAPLSNGHSNGSNGSSSSMPSPRQPNKRLATRNGHDNNHTHDTDDVLPDEGPIIDDITSSIPASERRGSNASNNGDHTPTDNGTSSSSSSSGSNTSAPVVKRKLAIQLSNKKRAMSSDDPNTSAPATPTSPLTPRRHDLYHGPSSASSSPRSKPRTSSSSSSSSSTAPPTITTVVVSSNGHANGHTNGDGHHEIEYKVAVKSSSSSSPASSSSSMVATSPVTGRSTIHSFPHLATPLYINNTTAKHNDIPKLVSLPFVMPGPPALTPPAASSAAPALSQLSSAATTPTSTPTPLSTTTLSSLPALPLPSSSAASSSSSAVTPLVTASAPSVEPSVASLTVAPLPTSSTSLSSSSSTSSSSSDIPQLSPTSSTDNDTAESSSSSSMNGHDSDRTSTKRKTHRSVPATRSQKRSKPDPATATSHKYIWGYLDFADMIMDGFFDAGRAATHDMELSLLRLAPVDLNAREILLIESSTDKRLSQLLASASDMIHGATDDALRVRLLAMFVSDSMGGRQDSIIHTDGAAMASDPRNGLHSGMTVLTDQCRTEVRHLKTKVKSNVLLIGQIHHGLCRHRALLMKYLCDHITPRIPCALVRGYREMGVPHAWNLVVVKGTAYIIDTLDAPHVLRDPRPDADGKVLYFPQYALSKHEQPGDLHDAVMGREIGSGAYARVFECHLSNYHCAVKICPTGHLQQEQFAMLLRELRVLPWLHHDNIVQFIGYVITDNQLRIFMENIRGPSLMQVIGERRRRSLPFAYHDALCLLHQIACGLQYLHIQNILHRDLKSGNILLGDKFGALTRHTSDANGTPGSSSSSSSSSGEPNLSSPSTSPSKSDAVRLVEVVLDDETKETKTPLDTSIPNIFSAPPMMTITIDSSNSKLSSSSSRLDKSSSAAPRVRRTHTARRVRSGDAAIKPGAAIPPSHGGRGEREGSLEAILLGLARQPSKASSLSLSSSSSSTSSLFSASDYAALQIKLCDFNVAVPLGNQKERRLEYAGTIRWMAPEVLRARYTSDERHEYGKEADIWSFGMVMYEVLTLLLPYEDLTEDRLLDSLQRGRRPVMPSVAASPCTSLPASASSSVPSFPAPGTPSRRHGGGFGGAHLAVPRPSTPPLSSPGIPSLRDLHVFDPPLLASSSGIPALFRAGSSLDSTPLAAPAAAASSSTTTSPPTVSHAGIELIDPTVRPPLSIPFDRSGLVQLFERCTSARPVDRPTCDQLVEWLAAAYHAATNSPSLPSSPMGAPSSSIFSPAVHQASSSLSSLLLSTLQTPSPVRVRPSTAPGVMTKHEETKSVASSPSTPITLASLLGNDDSKRSRSVDASSASLSLPSSSNGISSKKASLTNGMTAATNVNASLPLPSSSSSPLAPSRSLSSASRLVDLLANE